MASNKDYLLPINNLEFGDGVKNSIKLPNSTIFRADTFLKTKIAEKIVLKYHRNFFKKELDSWISRGFKALIYKRIHSDEENCEVVNNFEFLTEVMDELYFLLSSVIMFHGQGQTNIITKPNLSLGLIDKVPNNLYYCFDPVNEKSMKGSRLDGLIGTFLIDKKWDTWQRRFFFHKIRIFFLKKKYGRGFRKRLYNAMVLVGKAQISVESNVAFLLYMIAIETILCRKNDKYSKVLPDRLKALYGGTLNPDETYSKDIVRLYEKRCKYVHNGDKEKITWQDVFQAERIIFNLLITAGQRPELLEDPTSKLDDWIKIQQAAEIEKKRYVKNRGIHFAPPLQSLTLTIEPELEHTE